MIAGIGWELVTRAVELDSGKMPDFKPPPRSHSQHQVPVNGQPLRGAGRGGMHRRIRVALCYYEMPLSVRQTENGWEVESVKASAEESPVAG